MFVVKRSGGITDCKLGGTYIDEAETREDALLLSEMYTETEHDISHGVRKRQINITPMGRSSGEIYGYRCIDSLGKPFWYYIVDMVGVHD